MEINNAISHWWTSLKKYCQKKSVSFPVIIHKTTSILLVSILITVLLYIMEPFHMDGYKGNKFLFSLGFGLITFIVVFMFNTVIKKKSFTHGKTSWLVHQEILYILLLLLTISAFNYIYISCTILGGKFYRVFFFRILYYTLSFGIIPSVILTLLKYNKYLLSSSKTKPLVQESFTIPASSSTVKDIKIPIDQFIYAEAQRNNVVLFFRKKNGEILSHSIRIPLGKLVEYNTSSHLFRCHNSFLINLDMVESAKGNSNGFKLKMQGIDNIIMVSRRYAKDFQSLQGMAKFL